MTSTTERIQHLLQPPDSEFARASALAYLNASFPSIDSLSALSEVASTSKSNAHSLHHDLSESRSRVDILLAQTRSSAQSLSSQAAQFANQYHELQDDLGQLSEQLLSMNSGADRPPTLLEDIEASHRKLAELQTIKEYVQVIRHSLELREAAVAQMRDRNRASTIGQSSITQFAKLQDFVSQVTAACSATEDGPAHQALHLVSMLNDLLEKTWADIKHVLFETLIEASEKIKWPSAVNYASVSVEERAAFEKSFVDLVNLQLQGDKLRKPIDSATLQNPYPLEALLRPIALRFKYHFDSTRQTNKLDKPEWFFTHILNTAHDHRSFMQTIIQRLFQSTKYKPVDAWQEFVVLLLTLPSRKLERTIPLILSHPPLLAHTIYQSLSFDAALLEEGFKYETTTGASQRGITTWPGLSDVILGKKEWFQVWLEAEQRFMEEQYHDIVTASDAWTIAQDEKHDDENRPAQIELKPTNSARRIKALVEQVTDRYSPLPNFSQKTRFLVAVQLPILEQYHGRIASSLTAFEGFSSALIRAVPGTISVSLGGQADASVKVDTARLTSGPEGLSRLCKAYLSTKYVQHAMDSWGEEVFFLELWSKINESAKLRSQVDAVDALPTADSENADTIFEELISQYSLLAERAEGVIVQQVCGEVESRLRAHFGHTQSHSHESNQDDIRLAQTLLQPISLISSDLKVIRSLLPDVVAVNLFRKISSRLSDHILQRQILYRGHISLPEGRELMAESELWVETVSAAMGLPRARAEVPWRHFVQAARLVGADDVQALFQASGTSSDDEWGKVIVGVVGMDEMPRDEVMRVVHTRTDIRRS
ncbi:RINT-1 family protein [Pterulicium gracile]|uniref:RINT-1 family protein n=1 Tax=Pterulicium gracile TaxID=1884261 RepID=A0A5C3R0R1_9AGAR|nr:RINT-1 family protein [Pterula gracilis]